MDLLLYPPEPPVSISSQQPQKKRKARSWEERKKALEEDTRCDFVAPDMVFCCMCQRWIKLYKDVPYVDANWVRHAVRCEVRSKCVRHAFLSEPTLTFPRSWTGTYDARAEGSSDGSRRSPVSLSDHELMADKTKGSEANTGARSSLPISSKFCSVCNTGYTGSRLRHEVQCKQQLL